MTTLINDLKFAIRQLRKTPGFTAVAVLTLALAIGATTAITSVVRTALFEPLPMAHPERFLRLCHRDIKGANTSVGLNQIGAREVETETTLFRTVALSERDTLTFEGGEIPKLIGIWRVTEGFFRLLRVPPLLGRLPTSEEFRPGAEGVLVLGYREWRSEFGGDPEIVGRTLQFKRGLFTVVGVMPPEFRFPSAEEAWAAWPGLTATTNDSLGDDDLPWLSNTRVAVELKPGVSREQVQAWLDVIHTRQAQANKFGHDYKIVAQDLSAMFIKPELRRTLWTLFAMIVFVLLIATANIANLQLVHTETRLQEMNVRVAMGASRGRIFRQLLVESLLLATLGGVAGLLATAFGLEILTKLLPAQLPRLQAIQLDWSVLGVATLVTLATGVLFGVAPAWRGGETHLHETLKLGSGGGGRPRRQHFVAALVVGQVVLALVLMTGAGLMVRTVHELLKVDVGFDPARLAMIHPRFGPNVDGAQREAVCSDLRIRLAALPGVEAVGLINRWAGEKEAKTEAGVQARLRLVLVATDEADPLRAMRARLNSGRWLRRSDAELGAGILLNETAARRLWPGRRAIGQRLRVEAFGLDGYGEVEVAGVIADLREDAYNEDSTPTLYVPIRKIISFGSLRTLVMRTAVPYNTLREGVERELKAAGAGYARPILHFKDQLLYQSTAGDRTFMMYLLALALTGLGLAALGLYGILSFGVALRTREIGIRLALGATRREVTRLIVAQGMRLVAAGVGLGLVGALAATQWLRSFLFGIAPSDPVTLATVATLLVLVSLLACFLPARRASKTDPMAALRYE